MQPDPRLPSAQATHRRRSSRALAVAAGLGVAVCIVLGVFLRLADPLSSGVVPAEDPYTHMALVREHLRTGTLDPLNVHGTLYPPGLHAFLAAAWTYTGIDLYDIVRIGPVVFGAIGILGMAILLWRIAGPTAGFVGSLAMAVAPEAIFRTTMMSPTALDLALLPFLLLALLPVLEGRLRWTAPLAAMTLFLALTHPWLLAILAAAGCVFLLFAAAFPWSSKRAPPLSMAGLASCVAILGSSLGVALLMPGFGLVLPLPSGLSLVPFGLAAILLSLAPAGLMVLRRAPGKAPAPATAHAPRPFWIRAASGLALAAAVAGAVAIARSQGLPANVDLPRMLGWPILAFAFTAAALLPFIASPGANLAAALAATTLPFVLFNPLHSEFLPHRTAVFLGVALVALAGLGAAAIVRGVATSLANASRRRTGPSASRRPSRAVLLAAPAVLVGALLSGAVYAGTPDGYPGGWYRMYNTCELDALREVARHADAAPDAVVVVADWEAKLVLAALTSNASRVWYKDTFFTLERSRNDTLGTFGHHGRPLIVVFDRYLHVETPDAATAFASAPPWHAIGAWCGGTAVGTPRLTAYATGAA